MTICFLFLCASVGAALVRRQEGGPGGRGISPTRYIKHLPLPPFAVAHLSPCACCVAERPEIAKQ